MDRNYLIRKIISTVLCCTVLSLIYIIPVGLNVSDQIKESSYNIFIKGRLMLFLFAAFCLAASTVIQKRQLLEYSLLMLCFMGKYIIYGEIDLGVLYFIGVLCIFDFVEKNTPNFRIVEIMIELCSLVFLIQIFILSYINFKNGEILTVVSSVGDRNYTAYFILNLMIFYFYTNRKKKAIFFTVLGFFTYSRLFIIACIVGVGVKGVVFFFLKLKKILQLRTFWYIIVQILWLLISVIYVYFYKFFNPEYIYITGFKRLTNMFDGSNFIRCYANLLAVGSINLISFFIGLRKGSFVGLLLFQDKTIYPHNSIWSLYISYGFIAVYSYIKRFSSSFKAYENKIELFFIFLMYQCILGPSSFYGVDLLILQAIIGAISIKDKNLI